MFIITEGRLPREEVYRTTCNKCRTVFEFKAGEAERTNCQRDGDFFTVVCPLPGCGNKVTRDCR